MWYFAWLLGLPLAAAFAGTAAQAHGGHEPPAGARQDVGTSPWGPADEIGRLTGDGPDDDELQKAKDYLTGSYALGFDTSTKIANQLVQIAFEGLGMDYIARRNGLIGAVTQADIRRAAARTLGDGKLLVVAAGRPTAM